MLKYKWLAEYQYGDWYLFRFEVERETHKMFFPTNVKALHGWVYVGRKIKKDQPNIFDTPQAAIGYLLVQLKQRKDRLAKSIQKIDEEMPILEELFVNLEVDLPKTGII